MTMPVHPSEIKMVLLRTTKKDFTTKLGASFSTDYRQLQSHAIAEAALEIERAQGRITGIFYSRNENNVQEIYNSCILHGNSLYLATSEIVKILGFVLIQLLSH